MSLPVYAGGFYRQWKGGYTQLSLVTKERDVVLLDSVSAANVAGGRSGWLPWSDIYCHSERHPGNALNATASGPVDLGSLRTLEHTARCAL